MVNPENIQKRYLGLDSSRTIRGVKHHFNRTRDFERPRLRRAKDAFDTFAKASIGRIEEKSK